MLNTQDSTKMSVWDFFDSKDQSGAFQLGSGDDVKYLSLNKVRLVLNERSMLLIMVRDLTPIVLQ